MQTLPNLKGQCASAALIVMIDIADDENDADDDNDDHNCNYNHSVQTLPNPRGLKSAPPSAAVFMMMVTLILEMMMMMIVMMTRARPSSSSSSADITKSQGTKGASAAVRRSEI